MTARGAVFLRVAAGVGEDISSIMAEVINAASDLLVGSFGERGRHVRSAIGVAQLLGAATVEVEIIVEVSEG